MANNVAACGLYCGTCRKFRKGSCPGCRANEKAAWCSIRSCCIEHEWQSCAECTLDGRDDPMACRKLNDLIGKLFGLVFRSDRRGCLLRIRAIGSEVFAAEMQRSGRYNRPVTKI